MWVIKRAYEPAEKGDGLRVLVDRLWPRGMKKEDLSLDEWNRAVSPSPALRKWYSHDVSRWEEFRQRYRQELEANPAAWRGLFQAGKAGKVTLLFSARDVQHNSALVLKEFLEMRLQKER